MRHPYPIREIARAGRPQRGHGRPRAQRPRRRAARAPRRRCGRRSTTWTGSAPRSGSAGRTFLVDVVMQAPERFTAAVRAALEAELPALRPAVVRARFHFRETAPVAELVGTLDGVARRGSQGVMLKAPDVPEVAEASGRLVAAGIPVVTLVTDLPAQRARWPTSASTTGRPAPPPPTSSGQWLGDRARRRARHAQPQLLPRRGGARDGLPGDAAPGARALVEVHRDRRPGRDPVAAWCSTP